ncbi:MAG: transposase [Pseudomonadota bacterium]
MTDPDARASRAGIGYNAQIAVDTRHRLVAEQQVHTRVGDLGLLTETAAAARETLGVERIDAVADRGYFTIEDIVACEAAFIVAYVPKPIRGSAVRARVDLIASDHVL